MLGLGEGVRILEPIRPGATRATGDPAQLRLEAPPHAPLHLRGATGGAVFRFWGAAAGVELPGHDERPIGDQKLQRAAGSRWQASEAPRPSPISWAV